MKRWVVLSGVLWLCSCSDDGTSASGETDTAESSSSSAASTTNATSDAGSDTAEATTTTTGDTTDPSTSGDPSGDTTTGSVPNGTAGCGQDPSEVPTTITAADLERTFILRLPSNYDPNTPTPLVFAFHGLGGSANLAQAYFGLDAQIGDGAIIVYPDALPLDSFGGQTGWDLTEPGRDVVFFDEMLTVLTDGLCVDAERIFSAGHSFGGYFSNSLGCFRGDVLRAIAPVAGGGPFGTCTGNVAAWLTHGEADGTVDFTEGEGSRDHWRSANGCGDTTQPTAPMPCEAYDGCSDPVVWCPHPGGHEWPAFAAEGIWTFFSSF